MTADEWYAAHNCTHAHCPLDCGEHPQPFLGADGRMVCGRCAVIDGIINEMIPCNPETCEE